MRFYQAFMSNGLTFKILNIILRIFVPMLGYDFKIARDKFQGNRLIIDG